MNDTKPVKPNASQIGAQISQKYLPSVPRVIGMIEQSRKLIVASPPTT